MHDRHWPEPRTVIRQNLERFAALGLAVEKLTEMDVPVGEMLGGR